MSFNYRDNEVIPDSAAPLVPKGGPQEDYNKHDAIILCHLSSNNITAIYSVTKVPYIFQEKNFLASFCVRCQVYGHEL